MLEQVRAWDIISNNNTTTVGFQWKKDYYYYRRLVIFHGTSDVQTEQKNRSIIVFHSGNALS